MTVNPNYKVVEIADEYMAVPVGDEANRFNGVIALSEAAAFLLQKIDDCRSKNDLKKLLCDEYDIEGEVAEIEIDQIIRTFLDLGLILE